MAILPDFERLAGLLGSEDPSEIHGRLCGLLCADAEIGSDDRFAALEPELSIDAPLTLEDKEFIQELFAAIMSQLNDEDLIFSPLLPGDEVSLKQRAGSLGYWCQGFLTGLGLGGIGKEQTLPATVSEFLGDLSAIARLDHHINAESEDEESYMELVEYIRIGVLLVSEELRSRPATALLS